MSEKKLVRKLAEVMQEIKRIPKNGYNTFHKYHYATETDVNEKVRDELGKRHVIMIPNMKGHSIRDHVTSRGNKEYIATVEIEFIFMDGETGENISFTAFGEGQDAGDKGTYKAITGAQKYALMKAFMIPTGDDPEGDTGPNEQPGNDKQSSPRNAIKNTSTTGGGVDIKPTTKGRYQAVYKTLDGIEDFLKEHGDAADSILANELNKKAREQKGA